MGPWTHGPMGPRSRTTKPITFFPKLSIDEAHNILSKIIHSFDIFVHIFSYVQGYISYFSPMSRVKPPIYSLYVHGYPLTPIHIMWAIRYGDSPSMSDYASSVLPLFGPLPRDGPVVLLKMKIAVRGYPHGKFSP